MARIAIQSDNTQEIVAKLCFVVRYPYQILRNTGHGSYFVKKAKNHGLHFVPSPPSLKPCEPGDTTDTQYMNQSHAPLTNPLKKALHIELYNEKWFNKPLPTSIPPFTYQNDTPKNENCTPSFFSISD